jgi:hypothetical protein
VDVDCIIFDIEWGNGDRCYYTSNVSNGPLKWINATTGEYGERSDVTLNEQTVINKIPGQNYITAYLRYSGFIYIFDAQTGESVKNLNISLEQFWPSADGAYIFCPDRNVYRTSDFQSNSILPVAQLKVNESESIQWIDCDPDNLWALRKGYHADNRPEIWQLETVNYDIVKTLYYDEYCWATINGTYAEYPAEAHYVFAGREQNEIVAVKSLRDYGNVWALEYIPLF